MVRHVIDCYQLLVVSGDNASHVSLKLIVMLWPDQALPSLHSENDLDVDLRVRIRHSMSLLRSCPGVWTRTAIKMPLLRNCPGVWTRTAIKMSLLRSRSGVWTRMAIKMSLLRSCPVFGRVGYKDVAATELLWCLDACGYKDVAPTGAAQVFGRV